MNAAESDTEQAGKPQRAADAGKPDPRLRPQRPVLDLKATEIEPDRGDATRIADPAAANPSTTGENADGPTEPSSTTSAPEARDSETAHPGNGDPARSGAGRAMPAARGPRGAVVMAAACGAAAGALVSAAVLWFGGFGPDPSDAAAQARRIARIETEIRTLSVRASAGEEALRLAKPLPAELSRLEAAVKATPTGPDPTLGKQVAAFGETAKSLESQVADLRRRLDQAASVAAAARDAAMRSAGSSSAVATTAASDVEALTRRMQALEAAVQTLRVRANTPEHDQGARRAMAALALRGAVERGEPYAAELAALQSHGVDAGKLAPLRAFASTGVPSAEAMARELSAALAAAAPKPAAAAPESDTVLGRLQHAASGLVRITPADAPPASTPEALTPIKTLAMRGDLAGAAAAAEKLPAAERARLAPWVAKVRARAAALGAAQSLAHDGLAALGQDRAGSGQR
jgi:hypothetical protein